MSRIAPAPKAESADMPVKTGGKRSLTRTKTQYFGVSTLKMYKKVKDVHHLRQLLLDALLWSIYVVSFFGFVLSFHSVKQAAEITKSLDLYFSTTDNPQKYSAAWVDIQTEPDMWHYVDDVLIEELLFGEEYELTDHTDEVKVSAHDGPSSHASNSTGEYECDPDHKDEGVTLHYLKNSNVVAGGILLIQKRFTPGGELHDHYDSWCHDHSHYRTLDGKVLPCAIEGEEHSDVHVHGFEDPEVYKKLPGFKYNDKTKATATEGFHQDGYIIELNIDHGQTSSDLLTLLKKYEKKHWLDEYTNELVIEVALYNHNYKLWVEVQLDAVFDRAGSIKAKHHVQTINLEPYNIHNIYNVQRIVFEMVFLVVTIAGIVVEVQQFVAVKCNCKRYFTKFGIFSNLMDLLQLAVNLFLIGLWIFHLADPEVVELEHQLTKNTLCHAPDLRHVIEWEELFLNICCINIIFILLRGLKFLMFVKQFARIYRLFIAVAPELLAFMVPLFGVMTFVSLFGHVKYGKDLEEWGTLVESFFACFLWLFNMYDLSRIMELAEGPFDQTIELLVSLIVTLVTSVVLVNVMLAVLIASWDDIVGKNVDEEGLQERNDLIFTLRMFNIKSMVYMCYGFRDEDFLAVMNALKREYRSSKVHKPMFAELCKQKLNKSKAEAMVGWFFNDKGMLITQELIEEIRLHKQSSNKKYQYLFQRIEAETKTKITKNTITDM